LHLLFLYLFYNLKNLNLNIFKLKLSAIRTISKTLTKFKLMIYFYHLGNFQFIKICRHVIACNSKAIDVFRYFY